MILPVLLTSPPPAQKVEVKRFDFVCWADNAYTEQVIKDKSMGTLFLVRRKGSEGGETLDLISSSFVVNGYPCVFQRSQIVRSADGKIEKILLYSRAGIQRQDRWAECELTRSKEDPNLLVGWEQSDIQPKQELSIPGSGLNLTPSIIASLAFNPGTEKIQIPVPGDTYSPTHFVNRYKKRFPSFQVVYGPAVNYPLFDKYSMLKVAHVFSEGYHRQVKVGNSTRSEYPIAAALFDAGNNLVAFKYRILFTSDYDYFGLGDPKSVQHDSRTLLRGRSTPNIGVGDVYSAVKTSLNAGDRENVLRTLESPFPGE